MDQVRYASLVPRRPAASHHPALPVEGSDWQQVFCNSAKRAPKMPICLRTELRSGPAGRLRADSSNLVSIVAKSANAGCSDRLIEYFGMIAGRPSVEHLKIGVQNSIPPISNGNFCPGKQVLPDPFRFVEESRSTDDAVMNYRTLRPEG